MELVGGHADPLRQQDVMLYAKGTAIDLRGAQLDELEQLLVEAGLGRHLAQSEHQIIRIGRDPLEILVFTAGV
ncbi:hypothetical protein ACVWY3_002435 [Bradyrhizobium sp. USDA 4486]